MLRPSAHPFAVPARRAPTHRLALSAAAIGLTLAGAALLVPMTDEGLARALPACALVVSIVLLGGLLARLGRGPA